LVWKFNPKTTVALTFGSDLFMYVDVLSFRSWGPHGEVYATAKDEAEITDHVWTIDERFHDSRSV
jgi:hypothetical protein